MAKSNSPRQRRPRGHKIEPLTITGAVRFKPSQYKALMELADQKQMHLSTLIRETMQNLLDNQNHQQHSNNDFTEFLELYKTFKESMK